MRLVRGEVKKIFSQGALTAWILLCLVLNLLLLYRETSGPYASGLRQLTAALAGRPLPEQKQYVEERVETIRAFDDLDFLIAAGDDVADWVAEERTALLEKYGARYDSRDSYLFMDDQESELSLLQTVQGEIDTVLSYPDFLRDVAEKAAIYDSISIFGKRDDYESRKIRKTAADYRLLETVDTGSYYPQTGLVTAISFRYTDLLLVVCMTLVSGILISSEYDSGMLNYIRTVEKGRGNTALAKETCMFLSSGALVLLLYGSNLLFCSALFGFGDLSRPIQSVPFLMRSVLRLDLTHYLLLFLLLKWLSACVIGSMILEITLLIRRYLPTFLVVLTIYGASRAMLVHIPFNRSFSALKYLNPAGFLDVNGWLGGYMNLRFWGRPVHLAPVLWTVACLLWAFCLFLFLLSMEVRFFPPRAEDAVRSFRCPSRVTLFGEEAHKTLVSSGALLVLFVFILYVSYLSTGRDVITPEKMYYNYYMDLLTGTDPDTAEQLLEEELRRPEYARALEILSRFQAGEISDEEYDEFRLRHISVTKRLETVPLVRKEIERVREIPGAQVISSSGYELLFDHSGEADLRDTILTGAVLSLCLFNVFSYEKRTGMRRLTRTTIGGRGDQFRAKLLLCVLLSFFIASLLILCRFIVLFKDYSMPSLLSPACGVPGLSAIPAKMSILDYLLLRVFHVYAGTLICCAAVLLISAFVANAFADLFLSLLLLCAPAFLCLLGLEGARFFSVYPLFHFLFR